MKKIPDYLALVANIFASVALVIMLGMMIVVVIGRYFFSVVPPWSEELALFLMSWLGFLGATAIEREKGHIRVSFIDTVYPRWLLNICNTLRYIIKLFFSIVLAWYGLDLSLHVKGYFASVEIPKRISFYPGFIAGVLIAALLLLRFREEIFIWKKPVAAQAGNIASGNPIAEDSPKTEDTKCPL